MPIEDHIDSRIINTVYEMCKDREYTKYTPENEEDNTIHFKDRDNSIIVIFFTIGDDIDVILNTKVIKTYINYMDKNDIKHSIIIYESKKQGSHKYTTEGQGNITPKVKEIISKYIWKIEFFHENELKFNKTKHCLVPKHIPLNKKDTEEFKKQYGVKFPVILTTDPIARYFGLGKGDIVKIIRKNNGDDLIYYRITK